MYHLHFMIDGAIKFKQVHQTPPLVPRVDESVSIDNRIYRVYHVGYTYMDNNTHVIVSLKLYK